MTKPLDIEGMRLTMKLVEEAAKVGTWKQEYWVSPLRDDEGNICGTRGCFAGHFAFSQGFTTIAPYEVQHSLGLVVDALTNPVTHEQLGIGAESYDLESVASFAYSHLGLSLDEADQLFYSGNSLAQLRELVDDICAAHEEQTI